VRLGADVTVIYRRTREEMPAWKEEIDEALREGVRIETLTNPEEIITKDGKVTGVKCTVMKLGAFDRSGRRRPEKTEENFILDADQIIWACGQTLDCADLLGAAGIEMSDGTWIKSDRVTGQTSVPWIFAGGDASTGPMSVVDAISGGERAAAGIDQYLTGENHAFWRTEKPVDTAFDPDADPAAYPRKEPVSIPVERRKGNFDEVERPWIEAETIRQALRCLRCDYGK
jgi:NADH-quinone oxidoreductase subunit F